MTKFGQRNTRQKRNKNKEDKITIVRQKASLEIKRVTT